MLGPECHVWYGTTPFRFHFSVAFRKQLTYSGYSNFQFRGVSSLFAITLRNGLRNVVYAESSVTESMKLPVFVGPSSSSGAMSTHRASISRFQPRRARQLLGILRRPFLEKR
eukprot:2034628-Heterocapsa_arctica.AAC.1